MISSPALTAAVLWIVVCVPSLSEAKYASQLLLVSFDGFRWDYIDKTDTPNFDRFIKGGAHIKKMKDEFATITFPSHWTLVTGLYNEAHGVIANKVYDPTYNKTFSYSNDGRMYNDSTPIWTEVIGEGKKAGTYFWPGSDAEINGVRPTFYKNYTNDAAYLTRINTVVGWLKNEGVHFSTLYYNEPDSTGHSYGPDSPQVIKAIETSDLLLGYLLDELEKHELSDKVNVIVTSDHGMAYRPRGQILRLSNYIDLDDVFWYASGAVGNILPKNLSQTRELYERLLDMPNAQVFLKEDFPESHHYANHRRVHPILVLPDQGYYLTGSRSSSSLKGYHGYNPANDEMKTLLVGRGPNFCCGCTRESGMAIDVYAMMAELLDITPHPHNGSLDRISDILVTNDNSCWVTGASGVPTINPLFTMLVLPAIFMTL